MSQPGSEGLATILVGQRAGGGRYFDATGFPSRTVGMDERKAASRRRRLAAIAEYSFIGPARRQSFVLRRAALPHVCPLCRPGLFRPHADAYISGGTQLTAF